MYIYIHIYNVKFKKGPLNIERYFFPFSTEVCTPFKFPTNTSPPLPPSAGPPSPPPVPTVCNIRSESNGRED